jgi:hypothetical protein
MPYKFDISQFGDKPRTKLTFEMTNVSDNEVAVSLIDFPQDIVDIKLPNKIGAGKTEKGELILKDAYADKEFEKSVTLEFNDPQKSRFSIPLKRVIRTPSEPASNATEPSTSSKH